MTQLDIVIVGAGLSGLAASVQCALAGHKVTVLESARELAEIGAGLQLTPNATRLLQGWDVTTRIRGLVEPKTCTVYNYKGKLLAHEDGFGENMRKKYGAPFADCHRVDLQQALVKRARELGVEVHLATRVTDLKLNIEGGKRAAVLTESGLFEADLVVAADGLWSRSREVFLGQKDAPLPTGDLAFRIVLRLEQIKDEKLRKIVQEPGVRFWAGPDAHVVAYSMRGGEMFNVVLLVPDDLPEEVAKTEGSIDEMRGLFEGWDPILTDFLSCVDKVDKWKLMHRAEMPSWISDSGNFVMIGDSCHPMLPYLAQGANSSIEDGAVLGLLLSSPHFESRDQLPDTLKLFQQLRKSRGEGIVRETFKQRRDFHMRDGPEQEKRDELMVGMLGGTENVKGPFPSRWTCPTVQPWLYGYDAEKEVANVLSQYRQTNGGSTQAQL